MRQERESAKLAREQLVPAVGQRARRKPMGQPARLVSMVVLKALAQQVPVSTQSVRLTMRPALVQTQPVRCLQTLHMPGKIVPAINSISAVAAVRHRVLLFLKSA